MLTCCNLYVQLLVPTTYLALTDYYHKTLSIIHLVAFRVYCKYNKVAATNFGARLR
jgi:hypothetical protein